MEPVEFIGFLFMDVKLLRVKTIAFLHGNHSPGMLILLVIADVWGTSLLGEHVMPIIDFPVASPPTTIVKMGPQHIMVGIPLMVAPVHARFLEIDHFIP